MKAFASYNPALTSFYFVSVLLLTMFASCPVFQIFSLLGGALFLLTVEKSEKKLSAFLFYVLLIILITVTNPLFSHNGVTPLFFLNGNPVTIEAFVYGAALAVTLVSVLIWFRAMNAVMSSDKYIWLLGKAAPKLALVVSMTVRFIPLFVRRFKRTAAAQRGIGYYSTDSRAERVKNGGGILVSVVSGSLEQAMDTSSSMKARGYGIKGRTSFEMYKFTRRDLIMTLWCVLLTALSFVGAAFGDTAFYYYPVISKIPLTAAAAISYVSFFLLSVLPFALEVKEALVWKYCVSKI